MKTKITAIILVVLILVCACAFLACNGTVGFNKQVADLNYKFTRAIIHFADGDMEVEIRSWCDYDDSDMVQVTATDGTIYYTHGSNIILICDND